MRSCCVSLFANGLALRLAGRKSIVPCYGFCRYSSSKASSSSTTTTLSTRQSIVPPRPVNQTVAIDWYSSNSTPPFNRVIIYLPAGPIGLLPSGLDEACLEALVASSNTAVACINYRANGGFKFPIPLHDVLAGYDDVVSHIASHQDSDDHPARIGVCGQLFGGTLAIALALTECRMPSSGVVAAAVNNAIVDWTVHERLEEDMSKRKKAPSRSKMSSWELYKESNILPASQILKLRQALFSSPDAYFDSFASPVHFFRSPAIDCPQNGRHRDPSLDQDAPSAPVLVRRKARLVFPPASSDLVLPYVRMTSGESSILHSQCAELMQRIADSHVRRHLSSLGINEGRASTESAVNQERHEYSLNTIPGIGLWGMKDESAWKSDLKHVGLWFNDMLAETPS